MVWNKYILPQSLETRLGSLRFTNEPVLLKLLICYNSAMVTYTFVLVTETGVH